MRSVRYILSVGVLFFTLAWSLWYVFAGFGNPLDPFYWLYKYQSLESGWMSVGTILAGGAVVRLFGAHLLPLRLVGWACTVAAVVLPYCAFLNREQRLNNLHWLAVAFGLMGYGAFQEFSPGTLSVLFLSAIWVCAAGPASDGRRALVLTAVLAGIAVAVRFPNILVLLVLIPLWRKKSLWLVPVAAAAAGVVYLAGYCLITPAYMDGAMSSHGIGNIITKLWESGGKIVGYAFLWLGVWVIGERSAKSTIGNGWLSLVVGVVMGAALCYYITYAPPGHQWYNYDMTYMITTGCVLLAAATRRREPLLGVALLGVATLGTDTGFLKLFPAVVCLFAVAAVNHTEAMRRFLFPALVGMTAAVMVRFSVNCIGNYNLRLCNVWSATTPYEHIAVRATDEALLKQFKADYDSLSTGSTSVLSVGREMHRMRAVTGCEAARYNEFWSNIFDSIYTAKYHTIIETEHPVVFCSYTPNFKTKASYRDKHSAFEEMLRSEGYRELDRSKYKYMIYIPTTDDKEIQ